MMQNGSFEKSEEFRLMFYSNEFPTLRNSYLPINNNNLYSLQVRQLQRTNKHKKTERIIII